MILIPAMISGAAVGLLTAALDTTFIQSLIVGLATAVISGTFLLISTIITAREARKNRALLHDVKRKVGATHRAEDKP